MPSNLRLWESRLERALAAAGYEEREPSPLRGWRAFSRVVAGDVVSRLLLSPRGELRCGPTYQLEDSTRLSADWVQTWVKRRLGEPVN